MSNIIYQGINITRIRLACMLHTCALMHAVRIHITLTAHHIIRSVDQCPGCAVPTPASYMHMRYRTRGTGGASAGCPPPHSLGVKVEGIRVCQQCNASMSDALALTISLCSRAGSLVIPTTRCILMSVGREAARVKRAAAECIIA